MASSAKSLKEVSARLNENGRIVIPAEIRSKLGFTAGDTLLLRVEGDGLRIESYRARIRKIQESLRKYIPEGRCMSEELIAERREEARREMERDDA